MIKRFEIKESQGEKITIFVSREGLKEAEGIEKIVRGETPVMFLWENFIRESLFELNQEFWTYIKTYAKIFGLPAMAVLAAHGEQEDNEWFFYWDDKKFSVQKWVHLMDGKFGCLFTNVCNPKCATPKSKKSLLLVPDGVISNWKMIDDCHLSLIHPKRGEIDSYIIGYELQELKRLKKNGK